MNSSLPRALRANPWARTGVLAAMCLALIAVYAEFIADDLPFVCRVQNHVYLLPSITHPADLAASARSRCDARPAFGPLTRFGPTEVCPPGGAHAEPPSFTRGHLLGTDVHGRDVFARIVYGTRRALALALLAAAGFVTLGAILGTLAGFFGGVLDALIARLIESLTAFPTLVLVIVVQSIAHRAQTLTLLATLALTRWTEVARLVRAEVLLVVSQDYIVAARALGASPLRILMRHVVPNARAPVWVAGTFGVASVVLIEAALDFLGLAGDSGAPAWGETLSEAGAHFDAWWLLVFPGLALFVCVSALNLIGDALRDILDPRLRAAHFAHGERSEIEPPSSALVE